MILSISRRGAEGLANKKIILLFDMRGALALADGLHKEMTKRNGSCRDSNAGPLANIA